MTTTNETLTTTQIRALRDKAVAASDHALAAVCDRAGDLGGNWIDMLSGAALERVLGMTEEEARAEVAREIADRRRFSRHVARGRAGLGIGRRT